MLSKECSPDSSEGYAQKEIDYLHQGVYSERLKALPVDFSGLTVLDLGAGPGTWELALAEFEPKRIVWLDQSEAFLDIAQRLHGEARLENVDYQLSDLMDLDFPPASFDMVMCRLALYYASNEWRALDEMARIIRPTGYVYLEFHTFPWTWKRPSRNEWWKYPAVFTAPFFALLTRRKLIRTTFCVERFVRWRLARNGFSVAWREESKSHTVARLLFRRAP